MAEQADGSIIVDAKLDTTGFKADSAELQRSIKSLNTKVEALGPTLQKALSGNTSALTTFSSKASVLENTISDIETKMASLGSKRLPTEEYQWLTDEIGKAKAALLKLEEKQSKMEDTGVKQNSRAWKNLQYDIDLAKRKITDYEAERASMVVDGTAFKSGMDTAEYAQLESMLNAVNSRFQEMNAAISDTEKPVKVLYSGLSAVLHKIADLAKKGASGFSKLGKGVIGAASKMKRFLSASKKASSSVNGLAKRITGLGSMLKRVALRKIMTGVITSVKEGFQNLAQYSSQANADISALKSSLTRLKNSFASAFAPILTAATPALSSLIDHISTALTYVGKLLAALSGAKTFNAAVAVQEDYAASLNGTSKAAKDAKKQLAGFDNLNVLSGGSSNSSEGGGSVDPSEMFEEVPIESSITDFIGQLKEAFRNGNYAEFGKIFGNGINTALQKANDFIKWENIGGTVTKIVTGFAAGFNSLTHTVNWELIGNTIAQGLNSALNTCYLVITEFDWPAMAASLSQSLNGLVSGFGWGKLGTTLSTGFITALKTIRSAISTFDWLSLGKGVADGVNSIDWVGAFSQTAGALSDAVKGLLDLCIGFAENLDWSKLGIDLWDSLIGVVANIDWSGIVSKAFELLGAAIGGLAALKISFAQTTWESLKSAFEDTKNYFAEYIAEAGGNVIQGLFDGMLDALKNIGSWIKEHIFDPFINGFKTAFGIHSPSTVMAEQGGFLIQGLLNGITGVWSGITGFFSTALSGLKNVIGGAWNSISSTTSTVWNSIKSTTSTICSKIGGDISSKFSSVGTTISSKVNGFKSTISTGFESAKNSITGKLESAMSTVKNQGWSGVGSNICSGISSGIDSGWSGLTKKIGSVAGSLLESAKTALGIHSPSKLFHDVIGLNIGYGIGEGVEDSEGSILKSVSGVADAIADEFNAGEYSAIEMIPTGEINSSLDSFSTKITDSFTNLLDRLQAIANGVTFSAPVIAANGAVPYSVSAASGGAGGNITGAIEASNDELATVVAQVVANATTAIVGAIRSNGNTTVNIDTGSIATSVINEINRRTRMSGKSPLVG